MQNEKLTGSLPICLTCNKRMDFCITLVGRLYHSHLFCSECGMIIATHIVNAEIMNWEELLNPKGLESFRLQLKAAGLI